MSELKINQLAREAAAKLIEQFTDQLHAFDDSWGGIDQKLKDKHVLKYAEHIQTAINESCKPLVEALEKACIASCNCQTKTPDSQYHAMSCNYRIYREAIEAHRREHGTEGE